MKCRALKTRASMLRRVENEKSLRLQSQALLRRTPPRPDSAGPLQAPPRRVQHWVLDQLRRVCLSEINIAFNFL